MCFFPLVLIISEVGIASRGKQGPAVAGMEMTGLLVYLLIKIHCSNS